MSEYEYTQEETTRLRADHPLPPPCSYCGAEANYEGDDPVPHTYHAEGCEVAARIRELLVEGDR